MVRTPASESPKCSVDELSDRAGHVFDRHHRIDPVLVVEVDAVCSQTLQRPLNHLLDVLRSTQRRTRTLDIEPELAGDGDIVTERRECLSDKLFAGIRAVHLGGVEERDPSFIRRANGSDALVSVRGRSVIGADAHAPSAQFRDVQRSESSALHVVVAAVADVLGFVRARSQHQGSSSQPGTDEGGSRHQVAATDTPDIVVLSHFGCLLHALSVPIRWPP